MKEEDITLGIQRLIYTYILNNPGVHLRRISKVLDLPLGTLRYHLDYLEKNELIVSKKEKNLKIFFISGKLSVNDKNLAPLLQQKRFRDIILTILTVPDLTHSEISDRLSIKPSTLSKYMNILENRGVISNKNIGREKHYYLLDEKIIVRLLLSYKKSFWDSFVDNILEIYFEK